jgi:hypothetical protein
VAAYAVPVTPSASDEVVIVTGPTEAVTEIVNDLVATSFGEDESWTLTVNEDEPAVGGTPEITPLLLKVNPAGKLPDEMLQE